MSLEAQFTMAQARVSCVSLRNFVSMLKTHRILTEVYLVLLLAAIGQDAYIPSSALLILLRLASQRDSLEMVTRPLREAFIRATPCQHAMPPGR